MAELAETVASGKPPWLKTLPQLLSGPGLQLERWRGAAELAETAASGKPPSLKPPLHKTPLLNSPGL